MASRTQRVSFKVTLFEGAGAPGAVHRFALVPIWARLSRELEILASTARGSPCSFRATYVDQDGDNVAISCQADLAEALESLDSDVIKIDLVPVASPVAAKVAEAPVPDAALAPAEEGEPAARHRRHGRGRDAGQPGASPRRNRRGDAYIPVHLRRPADDEARPRGSKRRLVTFVEARGVPLGASVRPGERLLCQWLVRNDSSEAWPADTSIVCIDRHSAILAERAPVSATAAPGEEVELSAAIVAPEKPGEYRAFFRLVSLDLGRFGARLPVHLVVSADGVAASKTLRERMAALAEREKLPPAILFRLRHRGVLSRELEEDPSTAALFQEARDLCAMGLRPVEVVRTIASRREADAGPATTSSDGEDIEDSALVAAAASDVATSSKVAELRARLAEENEAMRMARSQASSADKAYKLALRGFRKARDAVFATRGELSAVASMAKANKAHLKD